MADENDNQEERGILCVHYDTTKTPACGKSGDRICSLKYIILELISCSLIVHLIGFSTAYWSHGTEFYHNGLWLLCGLNQQKYCQYLPYDAAWFEATQALETLGLIAALISLILQILSSCHQQSSTNKTLFVIGMVSTLIAAGLTVLGIVIYGARNRDLSWSYGLTVMAGIIYTGCGILMVLHLNLNFKNT